MIYDAYSERHFQPVLPNVSTATIDTALPTINFWILIYSLRFGVPSLLTYTWAFVRLTQARLVLTTIDNSPIAYQIKRKLPKVVVCAAQNGRRSTFGARHFTSFTDELRRFSRRGPNTADYYLTYGTTEECQFKDLIQAEFIPVGSFKNNFLIELPELYEQPTLTYISSFPNFDNEPDGTVETDATYLFFENYPISYRQYFASEALVVSFLYNYCLEKKINFQVAGKRSSRTFQEEQFFRSSAPGDWKFFPCNTERDSYTTLMKSHFVASVDSSLAYEMFGRGKRTAFFTVRGSSIGISEISCTKFGYPQIPDEPGPMWTNVCDQSEFKRITDFVTQSPDTDWVRVCKKYSTIVMQYDRLNSILAGLIGKTLGVEPPSQETIVKRVRAIYG